VQRVGRAGHQLHKISCGTILATGFDDLLESLVIARRAKADELERVIVHSRAADVLANQIAAISVEYGEIAVPQIKEIIGRSALFHDCGTLIDEVCAQMAGHRLIRVEGGKVITTARARRYLTGTLSMIHDERKVPVVDMVSRRTVGTLDESFVVGWVYTGAVFITKGQLWRVLDMEDGKLTVEPVKKAMGELPSWEGEQIPVPFAVAREVGLLRETRRISEYCADPDSIAFAGKFFTDMDRNRSVMPTHKKIVLENAEDGVICHVCAGHRANEALGRVLSILISARFGTTVGIELDAYRIFLRLPGTLRASDVRDVLLSLNPGHLEGILSLALRRTALYKWKLVQVAKKFGAVDPDADYERISLHRLTELFDGTVVQRETYRELFTVYMDVNAAATVVEAVRRGETEVLTAPSSILGAAGLLSSRDQVPPPSADQAVISTLKRRLAQEEVLLCCMHCRNWKSRTQVSRVPEHPQCPKCGARLIAALKPWDEKHFAAANLKRRSKEEKEAGRRLMRNANIVLSSGKKAVIALAARGVGPENASRIIGSYTDGDAFYREILKAERNFIKTHRFWQ
jgi:ATP-dependent Lhr-like helicase